MTAAYNMDYFQAQEERYAAHIAQMSLFVGYDDACDTARNEYRRKRWND